MTRFRNFFARNWLLLLIFFIVSGYVGSEKWEDYQRNQRLHQIRASRQTASDGSERAQAREVARQERIEREIRDEKANGVPIALAKGQADGHRVLPREWFYSAPSLPSQPTTDILESLGVTLENETPPEFGITDAVIRATADQSYELIGGNADRDLHGWSLHVRLNHTGEASTAFDRERRRVVISIDPTVAPFNLGHELAHVLLKRVTADMLLPGFINEFVAEAAEANGTPKMTGAPTFSYDHLNRPVLGLSKTLDGVTGDIGVNSPLDPFRYDLLRLGGEKIGLDRHRALAAKIAEMALAATEPISMADVKPMFEAYGLGDCVLFTETAVVGAYVDVAFTTDGVPFVLYKQVDEQGTESSFPANLRVTWRKSGKALWSFSGATNEGGVLVDAGGATYAPYADQYDVTIGTETVTYMIDGERDPVAVERTKTSLTPLAHSF